MIGAVRRGAARCGDSSQLRDARRPPSAATASARWLRRSPPRPALLIAALPCCRRCSRIPKSLAGQGRRRSCPASQTLIGVWYAWLGTPSTVAVLVCAALAAFGARDVWRALPMARTGVLGIALTLVAGRRRRGPMWSHIPLTLGRYLLPFVPLLLLASPRRGARRGWPRRAALRATRFAAARSRSRRWRCPCVALAVASPLAILVQHPNAQTQHLVYHVDFRPDHNPYLPYMVEAIAAVAVLGEPRRGTARQPAHRRGAVLFRELRLGRAALGASERADGDSRAFSPGCASTSAPARCRRSPRFRFDNAVHLADARGAARRTRIDYVVWQKPYVQTGRGRTRADGRATPRPAKRVLRERFGPPAFEDSHIIVVFRLLRSRARSRCSTVSASSSSCPPSTPGARSRRRGATCRTTSSTTSSSSTTRATTTRSRSRATLGLDVILHPHNMGYGANQKTCYREALARGADIVVMVHPDYQYDPRLVTAMAGMVASGVYDVVIGSRILGGGALRGGMPLLEIRRQPAAHAVREPAARRASCPNTTPAIARSRGRCSTRCRGSATPTTSCSTTRSSRRRSSRAFASAKCRCPRATFAEASSIDFPPLGPLRLRRRRHDAARLRSRASASTGTAVRDAAARRLTRQSLLRAMPVRKLLRRPAPDDGILHWIHTFVAARADRRSSPSPRTTRSMYALVRGHDRRPGQRAGLRRRRAHALRAVVLAHLRRRAA